jgi:uncharacterized protein
MKWRVLLIVAIVIAGLFFVRNQKDGEGMAIPFISSTPIPTATPFPFQEMTIPYLRSRAYSSRLGEQVEYRETATYTSYVTSYDSDGFKVNGLLTIPKSEGPHPAIVFVHGYIAPTIYKTTEKYVDYVDYLARNGFVVFKIDLRGHGESEGSPGGAYYSSDYVIDTLNAYSALENADFVDPKRIGLWGHSMAGNVTFRSAVAKQTIPAVVVWAGAGFTYTDLMNYRIMDNSYRPPQPDSEATAKRQKLRELRGEFRIGDPFWEQVIPTNYLEGVTMAIQLNHAVDDTVVGIEYSRNLDTVLDGTQIIHELNEYPSGGHNITGSSFSSAMRATVDFYKTHLGQ